MQNVHLDVDFVRDQFPAFAHPETGRWAFFENAGGSYVPATVIDKLERFFIETKVQPYGDFGPSVAAGEAMNGSIAAMAGMINASSTEELTLGPSTSMNFYVLAQALRPRLDENSAVVVTNQDHEANSGCWRRLAESVGAELREWQVDPVTGDIALDDLVPLLDDKVALVCFPHCSNIVGTVNDVRAIADMAHGVGALAIADGVSYAPHGAVDVQALGVDFYSFSLYKTFGPHLGLLWGRRDRLDEVANQGHFFNAGTVTARLNPAGPDHAEIGACSGITDYYDAVYGHHFDDGEADRHTRVSRLFELFASHEERLCARLMAFLSSRDDLRIVGRRNAAHGERAPLVSIIPLQRTAKDIALSLAARGVAARNGHFYGYRCVQALGVSDPEDGVLRMSLAHYNSEQDMDRLIEALAAAL